MKKNINRRVYIYNSQKKELSRFDPKVNYNEKTIKVMVTEDFIKSLINNKKIKLIPNIAIQNNPMDKFNNEIENIYNIKIDTSEIRIKNKGKKPNIDTKPTEGFSSI